MGLGVLRCSGGSSVPAVGLTFSVTNFEIKRSERVGEYLLVLVRYPDCTNYEGEKIMLYANCRLEDLVAQGSLDPHFSDNRNYHSPVARFEPTTEWWNKAVDLMWSLV